MTWYEQASLAFGTEEDVRYCAQIFADVETAVSRARPLVQRFHDTGDAIWSSETSTQLREKMEGVPELLRRFSLANGDVASGLRTFAPRLDDYQSRMRTLQSSGSTKASEIRTVEGNLDDTLARLRAQDGGLESVISWAYTYRDNPEVMGLNRQLDQLRSDMERLESNFGSNEDSFESAVAAAVDVISNADSVLYNNGWDKFWSQTLQPILEVVRIVLEIATVILMIAAIIFSGGTLLPLLALIAGVMLVAVSAADIVGSAAAGHEITGDQWLNLAIDVAAVATLGAARYAKGAKMAVKASRSQAKGILKAGRRINYIGKTSRRGKYAAKAKQLKQVKQANRAEYAAKMDDVAKAKQTLHQAERIERAAEVVEGSVDYVEAGTKFAEGDVAGGLISAGKGTLDIGGAGAKWHDAARAAHAGKGAIDGIGEVAEHSADHREHESPKDWPGLDHSGGPR